MGEHQQGQEMADGMRAEALGPHIEMLQQCSGRFFEAGSGGAPG